MTWAEFRQWAWARYRFRVPDSAAYGGGWRTVHTGRPGSGNRTIYGIVQQRRLATWLRLRDLIDKRVLTSWLAASESYVDGWLVNDGSGIRWVADPALERSELLASGFVAVRCGL